MKKAHFLCAVMVRLSAYFGLFNDVFQLHKLYSIEWLDGCD